MDKKMNNIQWNMIDEIMNFTNDLVNMKNLKSLANSALFTYNRLLEPKSSAFFLLNKTSYEFDFIMSIPDESHSPEMFDHFVEQGNIGKALKTGSFCYDIDNQWKSNFTFLPLKSILGINGLIIIETESNPEKFEISLIKLINHFSMVIGLALQEILLSEQVRRSNDLLDQAVAMRTLHLEEKSKELGEKIQFLTSNLMSSIPHEVRTPINQILGFSKYLKSHFKSNDAEEHEDTLDILKDIEDSAERLRRLFENYLFHTNLVLISMNIDDIENLQRKITYSPSSTIYETVMAMAYNNERQSDFVVNLVDSPIAIEESFLVKICEEIISNSLKFTPLGNKIFVSSYLSAEHYIITFKDFGCGMSEEHASQIGALMQFDRNKQEQQGLGLGLAIVSRILNIHRGAISIQSKLNEYTQVNISLLLEHSTLNYYRKVF
jgi:signal transduction histidine kinase